MNFFKSKNNQDDENWKNATTIYDFTAKDLDDQDVCLDRYRGKVVLIVNVASNCGFGPRNYQELNELYTRYQERGLAIIGFPCNQFAGQEPGCETDLKEFIKKKHIEWDIYKKINVNGDDAIPLYKWLKFKQGGLLFDAIKWNFTKFLVNRKGEPVARFGSTKNPKDFESAIEDELNKS